MERIITINSNELPKSVITKDILTDKLQKAGFTVCDEIHPETELIISIGGDGSFLQTVHDFEFPEVPILGINTGHLGFFPDFSPSDIDHFIESYLVGDYIVQEIPVLQSTVCTKSNCNDVFSINEVYHRQDMKKLKATQITSWLTKQGYLEEIETKDRCICKIATAHGEKIGITSIKKVNSRGEEYITNMYDRDAQKFVLTHVIPQLCKLS